MSGQVSPLKALSTLELTLILLHYEGGEARGNEMERKQWRKLDVFSFRLILWKWSSELSVTRYYYGRGVHKYLCQNLLF
jgi:hypothetical protein